MTCYSPQLPNPKDSQKPDIQSTTPQKAREARR